MLLIDYCKVQVNQKIKDQKIKYMLENITTAEALKQALRVAAGAEASSPVLTTNAFINMQACLWANLVELLDTWRRSPGSVGQEYGLVSEYAKRIGRNTNTVKDWVRNLEAKGMIHPIQGAPSRPGAKGDTLYNFAEVDIALRAVRVENNKSKAA